MAAKILTVAFLAAAAVAKTDLEGCTSSDFVATPSNGGTPFASRIYWVPDTGEICSLLDCGGGRAPPKTTVPGCGNYVGTETYSPDFLPSSTATTTAAPTDGETTGGSETAGGVDEPEITGSTDGSDLGDDGSSGSGSSDDSGSGNSPGGSGDSSGDGVGGGVGISAFIPGVVGCAVLAGLMMG